MDHTPVIDIAGASKSFGRKTPFGDTRKKVLDRITLQIMKGEIVCLLGPSGCGKTTLVNMIMGNLIPDEGEVRVMGELAPYHTSRQCIGFMPQEDALYADITAQDNLRFFGSMQGMTRKQIAVRSKEMLAFGRLQADARKLVSAYSGGMKRRLSLAVAMLHSPDLLVLDEPTVGLDPDHRKRIWERFEQLREEGHTILVTTHVMDEAERCSRIAMLHNGCLIADGSPQSFLAQTNTTRLEDAFIALERQGEVAHG